MSEEIYEQLTDALVKRGGAIPPKKCKEFYALVEELFTEEQAEMAVKMPMGPVSADQMAEDMGISVGEAESQLEGMADLVMQLDEGISEIENAMHEPSCFQQEAEIIQERTNELEALREKLDQAYARWEELEAKQS